MNAGSGDRYGQGASQTGGAGAGGGGIGGGRRDPGKQHKFVPEGVEGLVPYRGSLTEFVYQMVGGLKASMGYCGSPTLADFRAHTRFVRITSAGMTESHPHNIKITREAPNYTIGASEQND